MTRTSETPKKVEKAQRDAKSKHLSTVVKYKYYMSFVSFFHSTAIPVIMEGEDKSTCDEVQKIFIEKAAMQEEDKTLRYYWNELLKEDLYKYAKTHLTRVQYLKFRVCAETLLSCACDGYLMTDESVERWFPKFFQKCENPEYIHGLESRIVD